MRVGIFIYEVVERAELRRAMAARDAISISSPLRSVQTDGPEYSVGDHRGSGNPASSSHCEHSDSDAGVPSSVSAIADSRPALALCHGSELVSSLSARQAYRRHV